MPKENKRQSVIVRVREKGGNSILAILIPPMIPNNIINMFRFTYLTLLSLPF